MTKILAEKSTNAPIHVNVQGTSAMTVGQKALAFNASKNKVKLIDLIDLWLLPVYFARPEGSREGFGA